MEGTSKMMRITIVVGNIICILMAILILCLSLGHWHEYTGGSITLLISIFGLFVACVYSHIVVISFAILTALDLLIMLANGIYLIVITVGYSKYCFNFENDALQPTFGCDDWRYHGHYSRAIAVVVCLFIGVATRLINFGTSCMLARLIYSGDNGDDPRVKEQY